MNLWWFLLLYAFKMLAKFNNYTGYIFTYGCGIRRGTPSDFSSNTRNKYISSSCISLLSLNVTIFPQKDDRIDHNPKRRPSLSVKERRRSILQSSLMLFSCSLLWFTGYLFSFKATKSSSSSSRGSVKRSCSLSLVLLWFPQAFWGDIVHQGHGQ